MTTVLSFVNLKGGVGKTALAVNFAAYCGRSGLRTLLVDLDPQTNATFSVVGVEAWREHAATRGSVADLLGARAHTSAVPAKTDPRATIVSEPFAGVDLVPSHLDLFTIDLDLASATARETRLRRSLEPILADYRVVVCDCPPNLTLPTQNALALSTHYAVPISPDFLSSLGVALLKNRIAKLSAELEHEVALAGIVISRVGRPAIHREVTVATLRSEFGSEVLMSEIHERVAVSEAAQSHRPVFEMGDYESTREFESVSDELLRRIGVRK